MLCLQRKCKVLRFDTVYSVHFAEMFIHNTNECTFGT